MENLNADFQDLISSSTANDVEYLLVGAHALAFHGVARYTEDLGLWVRRFDENLVKVRNALLEFGVPRAPDPTTTLHQEHHVIWFGIKPRRIEILSFLDGCQFESSFGNALRGSLGGVEIRVLSLPDYVATKLASGRAKDLNDLAMLPEAIGELPGDP